MKIQVLGLLILSYVYQIPPPANIKPYNVEHENHAASEAEERGKIKTHLNFHNHILSIHY